MGAYIVHPSLPAFAALMGPNGLVAPLSESTLDTRWVSLDEEAQVERLRAVWASLLRWAVGQGADRAILRVTLGDARAREWLNSIGVKSDGRLGPLEPALLADTLLDAFPLSLESELFNGTTKVAEVYGSWDGMIAYTRPGEGPPKLGD
ncbi:hypothetical protein GXP71_16930 [Cellulomonas sp. H30R-01]|uniref:hypothetical protein n=1 Tax=Cellulomonas sp. H30R-01 TaxID=2704467 RepID=UPI00138D48CC|nr:hypothetical protein [Cellulomonas sp. H30R-01]QHT57592.1 hypothetical protein GXP71_16930 [Cellulomonas sp. H30R-01]